MNENLFYKSFSWPPNSSSNFEMASPVLGWQWSFFSSGQSNRSHSRFHNVSTLYEGYMKIFIIFLCRQKPTPSGNQCTVKQRMFVFVVFVRTQEDINQTQRNQRKLGENANVSVFPFLSVRPSVPYI